MVLWTSYDRGYNFGKRILDNEYPLVINPETVGKTNDHYCLVPFITESFLRTCLQHSRSTYFRYWLCRLVLLLGTKGTLIVDSWFTLDDRFRPPLWVHIIYVLGFIRWFSRDTTPGSHTLSILMFLYGSVPTLVESRVNELILESVVNRVLLSPFWLLSLLLLLVVR